jgi:hypothetical protein
VCVCVLVCQIVTVHVGHVKHKTQALLPGPQTLKNVFFIPNFVFSYRDFKAFFFAEQDMRQNFMRLAERQYTHDPGGQEFYISST